MIKEILDFITLHPVLTVICLLCFRLVSVNVTIQKDK